MQLSDRKKMILSAIVNLYIATGEPVGSKLLADALGLNLSSATLRNEMSDLAEHGYLDQPHTSAGRVPTQLGYRTYVDALMKHHELTDEERGRIDKLMNIRGADLESLLTSASELLADVTGCVAVSAVHQSGGQTVRRIELAPASRRSVLIVILTSSGIVKSRICHAGDDIDSEMTTFFTNLLNDKIGGKALNELTPEVKDGIVSELYEYKYALSPVLDAVIEELGGLVKSEVIVGGETNLIGHAELMGDKALEFIRFLETKADLAHLMDDVSEGVRVRIGTEIGPDTMKNSSVIAAPYRFDGAPAGAIGIIGPTRMDYSRLMSNMNYFSAVLSKLINDTFSD